MSLNFLKSRGASGAVVAAACPHRRSCSWGMCCAGSILAGAGLYKHPETKPWEQESPHVQEVLCLGRTSAVQAPFYFWLLPFNVHISRFQHRMVSCPADVLYEGNSSCFRFLALFSLPGLGWVRNDLSKESWGGFIPQ